MNWDDPVSRARLIEQVGPKEYTRQIEQHFRDTTVAVVNGYPIRPIMCRFGRVYMVDGLNSGHQTLEGAKKMAHEAPRRTT